MCASVHVYLHVLYLSVHGIVHVNPYMTCEPCVNMHKGMLSFRL